MTLSHAKMMLLGLYACAFSKNSDDVITGNPNPPECHLFTKRNELEVPEANSYKDWYEWVIKLSDEEAERIYQRHIVCLGCKEDIRKRIESFTSGYHKPVKPE